MKFQKFSEPVKIMKFHKIMKIIRGVVLFSGSGSSKILDASGTEQKHPGRHYFKYKKNNCSAPATYMTFETCDLQCSSNGLSLHFFGWLCLQEPLCLHMQRFRALRDYLYRHGDFHGNSTSTSTWVGHVLKVFLVLCIGERKNPEDSCVSTDGSSWHAFEATPLDTGMTPLWLTFRWSGCHDP